MIEEIEQYCREELLIGEYKENLSSDFKLYISVEELIENKRRNNSYAGIFIK